VTRPLRIQYPGAFYHVTSRGNDQKEIFKSQREREKFLDYLETPAGNLSQIMRHINGAYTTYFNVKRKRAGHLFQGRCKAILAEPDEYATKLSRYLHLNPVRVEMTSRSEEYRWFSYRGYMGLNKAADWLSEDFILGYLGGNNLKARNRYDKLPKICLIMNMIAR